jgi:glucose/arabinose dehydrogenase
MAFLPNDDILVTERPGRLRLIRDGEVLPSPVLEVDVAEVEVFLGFEGGGHHQGGRIRIGPDGHLYITTSNCEQRGTVDAE